VISGRFLEFDRMRIILGVLAAMALATPALAQDAAAGANVFRKCQSCHAVGEGAKNRVGPVLNGVIGRVAGTAADYKYSQAMIDAGTGGLTWTPETLAPFLAKPRATVVGTKMAFSGIANPDEIANVIAYLETFSPPLEPAPAQ
jgi:cytochrome c2